MHRSAAASFAVVLYVCSLVTQPADADVVISSVPDWNGTSGQFISGTRVAIGQTFTAPANVTTLEAFSFEARIAIDVSGVRAYVFAASGNGAVGAPLFRSGLLPAMAHTTTFSPLTISGVGVPVTPGQRYIVLLSNVEDGPDFSMDGLNLGATLLGSSTSAPLLDNGVFLATQNGLAGLTEPNWHPLPNSRDFAVELRFIPAPGASAAFGLSLLAVHRRRVRGTKA